jgi:hypothetical protein
VNDLDPVMFSITAAAVFVLAKLYLFLEGKFNGRK